MSESPSNTMLQKFEQFGVGTEIGGGLLSSIVSGSVDDTTTSSLVAVVVVVVAVVDTARAEVGGSAVPQATRTTRARTA